MPLLLAVLVLVLVLVREGSRAREAGSGGKLPAREERGEAVGEMPLVTYGRIARMTGGRLPGLYCDTALPEPEFKRERERERGPSSESELAAVEKLVAELSLS